MEHILIRHLEGLHNDTRSGVSRCFPGVYLYPFSGPPGGAGRSNTHCGRGVVSLVGLGCWQSLRRHGGSGN